jgi:peroxiredoxin family protein
MVESKKIAMVVSEGTFDKAMMPMMIGNTAASMGVDVHIFFTFFGLGLLKKTSNPKLPGLMRIGTGMFKKKMKKMGLEDFQGQLKMAKELGIHLYACSTTVELMGMKKEDMVDGVTILGAAGFLDIALDSNAQFFIG